MGVMIGTNPFPPAGMLWDSSLHQLAIDGSILTTPSGVKLRLCHTSGATPLAVENTDTTGTGRTGMRYTTQYPANAGDYFTFTMRGDQADVVQSVYDVSATTFWEFLKFKYLTGILYINQASQTSNRNGDFEVNTAGYGVVVKSAGGNRFRIYCDDAGNILSVAV